MTLLYYQPASASFSSSIQAVSTDPLAPFPNIIEYNNITLITGSGVYNIYTGSIILATYPIEDTIIYYSSSYLPNTVAVEIPPTQSTFLTQYIFTPNIIVTSSNDVFTISGSLYTASFSQSSAAGGISLNLNTNYLTTISGSGLFYTSSLIIINTSTGITSSYITASNTYISSSFSGSLSTDSYIILAKTETLSGFMATFSSSADIPVLPTGSLVSWSAYLNATASYISSSGNTFYLAGGNLSTINSIIITGSALINFNTYGITELTSCSFYNNKLSTFPNVLTASNLQYFNVESNLISGSIPSLPSNIRAFIAQNNKLSGSIPNLSSSYSLQHFDVSNNYITGNINLTNCYNLQYFDVNNNLLSGSVLITGSENLKYINISNNNQLTGSLPNLSNLYNLTYINYSYTSMSGNIPSIASCSLLTDFICEYNGSNNVNPQEYKFTETFPSTLLNFQAFNANFRKTDSIENILYGLDAGGGISGSVNLSGSNNAVPSFIGYSYTASLKNKGWTVYTN